MKKAFFISVSLIMFIASISLMTGCDTCDEIEDLATIFSEGVVGFHYFPGQMTYYFDLETGTCSYDPGPNADFMLDLNPEDIDENVFSNHLYTAGLEDPDLLIRTANERRISNFLLWQISYAEIHVTDVFWPEFRKEHLHAAIKDFASRQRRYGSVLS